MFLLALLLGPAEAVIAQAVNREADSVLVARFALPNFEEGSAPDEKHPYAITRSGDVTLGGQRLSDEDLAANLITRSLDGETSLAISIDPRATLPDIVSRLAIFGVAGEVKLLEIEKYRTFSEPSGTVDSTVHGPVFSGTPGRFELPVAVGLADDGKSCIATLDGMTFADGAFYDKSFELLDRLVQREGGVEGILVKTSNGLDVVARVQSSPNTPWRCMAGAIYAVQRSGWPVVQLEVAGE